MATDTVSVLIPFAGECPYRHRALAWVVARHAVRHIGWDLELAVVDADPWRKGAALGRAFRRTTADIVILHDADVWSDQLGDAVGAVADGMPWSIPHSRVHRLDECATCAVLEGAEPSVTSGRAEPAYRGIVGGGIVVLRRDVFERVPVDPRFEGWGQEDQAHALALTALAGPPRCFGGELWHLWHPPAARMTRRVGSRASRVLHERYRAARRDREQMEKLIDEARVLLAADEAFEEARWPAT